MLPRRLQVLRLPEAVNGKAGLLPIEGKQKGSKHFPGLAPQLHGKGPTRRQTQLPCPGPAKYSMLHHRTA